MTDHDLILCTLCLNEMEFLPDLYQQHKDWPNLRRWIFVESADRAFAKVNSHLVSDRGLSVDGTTEYLKQLSKDDPRVIHIPFGFCGTETSPNGKSEARNAYFQYIDDMDSHHRHRVFIYVVDADEFYTREHQSDINLTMNHYAGEGWQSFLFKQRHIWHPDTADFALFDKEVVGGYWAVPHCRGWVYCRGMRHVRNHNVPYHRQMHYQHRMLRTDMRLQSPQCVHLGFAAKVSNRHAKHQYYIQRGEGSRDGRRMYVNCRRAYENWKPGDKLLHQAKIIDYRGPVPEVFR